MLVKYPADTDASSLPMTKAFAQPERLWLPLWHDSAGGEQPDETHALPVHTSPPVQSAADRHWTHLDVLPWSRHRGVVPEHALHVDPHDASVLHTAHAPDTQAWFAAHEVDVHVQAPPEQVGVAPEQATQLAPHFCAVSHVAHVPPLHQRPLPHWLSVVHWTQLVAALQTSLVAVQSVHDAPQCWSEPHVAQLPALHHLPEPQSDWVEQFRQTPFEQPYWQLWSEPV